NLRHRQGGDHPAFEGLDFRPPLIGAMFRPSLDRSSYVASFRISKSKPTIRTGKLGPSANMIRLSGEACGTSDSTLSIAVCFSIPNAIACPFLKPVSFTCETMLS